MSKVLNLYCTFSKTLKPLQVSGKVVKHINGGQSPSYGSLYICGPTVYSECHLGHAITYIRADLLRRFLRSIFNVKLITVMNITDIDDKILARTNEVYSQKAENGATLANFEEPSKHPFNKISDKYYKSFMDDMESIRVRPPDLTMRVSKYIHLVTEFISRLEENGHAYVSPDGDMNFEVDSVRNYVGRSDPRQQSAGDVHQQLSTKKDPRDFVLWKSTKPNEPVWSYRSRISGQTIRGRPGWHVQCSAISSAIFGKRLDIHYGGKDLIFPHHYNEEACCCAYHNLETANTMHVWTGHWLHSGHLVLKDSKMSKSLGNVVAIKNFISRTSVNALRLLCINSHYRADIQFDEDLFERCRSLDHKLNAFSSFLRDSLRNCQENLTTPDSELMSGCLSEEIQHAISVTYDAIVDGVCEDLNLDRGLESILNLARLLYSKDTKSLNPKDIIAVRSLLQYWCDICGLEYGISKESSNDVLLDLITNYRQTIRSWAINELRHKRDAKDDDRKSLNILLEECDKIRSQLDELGFVIRDKKVK